MSSNADHPIVIVAVDVPPRATASLYPPAFAPRVAGREKRVLGQLFGLENFGVNHTTLAPGAASALRHAHAKQDEFIYILQGKPTLMTDAGEVQLSPGMCVGFRAGSGNAHHLLNLSDADAGYLEIGDRTAGDSVVYPDDDLCGILIDEKWAFTHKDGSPY